MVHSPPVAQLSTSVATSAWARRGRQAALLHPCTRACSRWLRAAHSSTGTRLLGEAWHPDRGWQPARRWRREPPAGYRGMRWRSPGCRCCPGSTVLGPHCGVFPLETPGTVARPGRGPPPAGSLLGRRLRCLWWRGGGAGAAVVVELGDAGGRRTMPCPGADVRRSAHTCPSSETLVSGQSAGAAALRAHLRACAAG